MEPLRTKRPDDIAHGLKGGFHDMQARPESIYSDDESAFNSKLLQEYFKLPEVMLHMLRELLEQIPSLLGVVMMTLLEQRIVTVNYGS